MGGNLREVSVLAGYVRAGEKTRDPAEFTDRAVIRLGAPHPCDSTRRTPCSPPAPGVLHRPAPAGLAVPRLLSLARCPASVAGSP